MSAYQDAAIADFVAAELAAAGHPVPNRLTAVERDTIYYALVTGDTGTVTAVLAAHRDRQAAEPPLTAQCLRHEVCDAAGEHNAATRAAFEGAGYTDFDGTGEAA
jgi:hypothetical protein